MTPRYPRRTYSSSYPLKKDFCRGSRSLSSGLCKGVCHISSSGISTSSQNAQTVSQNTVSDSAIREEGAATSSPSNGRVMLIDGTSIIYRAYYKLLVMPWITYTSAKADQYSWFIIAKLHHGHLSHADGNGDWVLTIFSALSLIIDVLEFIPSHVAGSRMVMLLFRPNKVLLQKVPGVEADDVIGTLAVRSVNAGYKVRVVSPDKDFFQILSPSLRLLRIAPRGVEMSSFGMEDFAKKYGTLNPSQFVDVISLVGDKSDNIPGVEGIGNVHAVQLITKFGTLENLLQCVEQVDEERIKKALISNAEQAILSKNLAMLRSDLPFYMVPFTTKDLTFTKPEDNGEKFTSLLTAISAYAEGFSADSIIRRAFYLWKKLGSQ
ncbi:UNVERIFIED_CONTAM: DNA polymerase I [Sesamum angustifolium]|uniref:DNA polymerase I n=1 Tax=Sesamum angustifolium TaxID=2727405 RepID=A0AAW2LTQ7_9LAMI